ncbi:MAG: hypothetical protein IPP87_22445 [Ideonella sp.]|nr:hypothetical protein [Ideonella sp.]
MSDIQRLRWVGAKQSFALWLARRGRIVEAEGPMRHDPSRHAWFHRIEGLWLPSACKNVTQYRSKTWPYMAVRRAPLSGTNLRKLRQAIREAAAPFVM